MKAKSFLYFSYSRLKLILFLSILFFSKHDLRNINVYQSEIKLVIKGSGNLFFLNHTFNPEPSDVIINNERKDPYIKSYYFTQDFNNVTIKFGNLIESCERMFEGLDNIIEIDLSNFNTSEVTRMDYMFSGCSNLKKINFGNINTSLVTTMSHLFDNCKKLTSINLSKFDTHSVTDMERMFVNCKSLTSIDASNFDTKNVENMLDMFGYCDNLITVNISNFNTPKLKNIQGMFIQCVNLKYLDLHNFDTSSVDIMALLFSDDKSLVYIKLNHFKIKGGVYYQNVFNSVSSNLKVCIENGNTINLLQSYVNINCEDICFKNDIKINLATNSCIEHCYASDNKFELNNLCYKICPNTSFLSSYNEYLCLDKSSEGSYYFDENKNLYKECYNTCKRCNEGGNETNHNCIECNNNFPIELKINNYHNCFNDYCTYFYFFDKNNNYHCTNNNGCPVDYPLLDKRECKISNENKIKEVIKNLNNEINKEDEINFYNTILKNVEDIFASKDYVTSKLDNGNDEILEIDKLKIRFTTTENQKNNINSDMITIDIGECESSIRQVYNLSNKTLYIKMLEIKQEGMKIPKIEYDIYSKLNNENLTKLNLDSCQNNKISLLMPVNNKSNLDKLNSSSDYYNDVCYIATSDSGTDITLNDRKSEYPSIAICQNDCEFIDYNATTKKAKCSCKAKESSSSFADMKINKNKLLDNFKNIKNIINYKLLKCVQVLFFQKWNIKKYWILYNNFFYNFSYNNFICILFKAI